MPKLNFNFSKKKLLLLGFLFVMLLVIPLTVYLVQQQQQTQSHANPNTTLTFSPAAATKAVGDKVTFNVLLSPGGNQVNFVKLVIKFDATKLEAKTDSFSLDPASNLSLVGGPTVTNGSFSVTLSLQGDPTKVIQTNTKIGSITFNVINSSEAPTEIAFDAASIQIRSINKNGDAFNENVFLNGAPAELTIQGNASTSPGPSSAPTSAPTNAPTSAPTSAPTTAPTSPPSVSGSNQAPVCESLKIDPSAVGTAPYDVTFTVTGNDTDGTIDKVTFNYGDGPTEEVTTGGGIGTDTVSLEQAHTYETSGSFTATAQLTDDQGGVSSTSTCTQAVTVSAGGEASNSASITPLAATGPSNKIIGLGAFGGILFVIGALLFLAL